jgi:hypothetical protein
VTYTSLKISKGCLSAQEEETFPVDCQAPESLRGHWPWSQKPDVITARPVKLEPGHPPCPSPPQMTSWGRRQAAIKAGSCSGPGVLVMSAWELSVVPPLHLLSSPPSLVSEGLVSGGREAGCRHSLTWKWENVDVPRLLSDSVRDGGQRQRERIPAELPT